MRPRPISGSCHCGNIRFAFTWPCSDAEIPVRACSCSFCTKLHGVYTSHPEATLDASISDESQVSRYRFATGTADFHVCSRCGVVPFVTSRIDGRLYAVVNVNTFDDIDRSSFVERTTDFDGESTASRLARRQETWIPRVSIVTGNAG